MSKKKKKTNKNRPPAQGPTLPGTANGARLLSRDEHGTAFFRATSREQIPGIGSLSDGNRDMARIVYDNTTMHVTGSNLELLITDYNRELVEHGFGMSRRDIRKLDTIDTRNLIPPCTDNGWEAPKPGVTFEEKQFLVKDYWYGFIPCFEEGVLHVNSGRYIYWNIKEISIGTNRMDIFLQDYVWYSNTGWQPGVCGVVTWSFDNPEYAVKEAVITGSKLRAEYAIVTNRPDYPEPHSDYGTIYRILDYEKDMGWHRSSIDIWERTVVRYADSAKEQFFKQSGKTMLEELAHLFTTYILKVNKALSDNKVRKSRPVAPAAGEAERAAAPKEHDAAQAADDRGKPEKTRRIRTIGLLEVTSRDVPKASTMRTIAHYKVASWPKRGHTRTYKSGKKVYIRETIARRKALQGGDAEDKMLPTTIQFRKRVQNHEEKQEKE